MSLPAPVKPAIRESSADYSPSQTLSPQNSPRASSMSGQTQKPRSSSESSLEPREKTGSPDNGLMQISSGEESPSSRHHDPDSELVNESQPTLKRGAWSPQEDEQLIQLVESMRPLKWVHVAAFMKTRTSKQCRERYHNYLKPSLSRAPITKEEGRKIEKLVAIHGKRWAEISRQLPGRSDNAIKNWWNASANRRRTPQDVSTVSPGAEGTPELTRSSVTVDEAGSMPQIQQPVLHTSLVQQDRVPISQAALPHPAPTNQDAMSGLHGVHDVHVPAPVRVAFNSMYSERMQSPHAAAPSPSQTMPLGPVMGAAPGSPLAQQPGIAQAHGAPQPLPHGGMNVHPHVSHLHAPHVHHPTFASHAPYPLNSRQRANSRAQKLSVASLASSVSSRSNSIAEDGRASPVASPPIGVEDAAAHFNRRVLNSEIRRGSSDRIVADATSLSHYSLQNGSSPPSRRGSLQPQISAELVAPPPLAVPSSRLHSAHPAPVSPVEMGQPTPRQSTAIQVTPSSQSPEPPINDTRVSNESSQPTQPHGPTGLSQQPHPRQPSLARLSIANLTNPDN